MMSAKLEVDTRVWIAPDKSMISISLKIGCMITSIQVLPDYVTWYKSMDDFPYPPAVEWIYRDSTKLLESPTAQELGEICLSLLGLPS